MKYKFLERLTSDVLFEAYGQSLEEVFANAAEAMLAVYCDLQRVEPVKMIEIELEEEDEESLLHAWLRELLVRVELENMFFSRFEVKIERNEKVKLRAKIWGDRIKPELVQTVVKGVTYHEFELKKENGFKAKVCVDI